MHAASRKKGARFLGTCCCCYLTPFEGGGHGGKLWSPRSQATPQSLYQKLQRQRVAKEQATQTVHWTVQNKMRGVLGWVSTGVARRILDFAIPR